MEKTRLRLGEDLSWTEGVRLWDYRQIDQLPSQQRQVVNLLFQEIEVVRMVDHLVGALFFLHHYQIPHGAVRPKSVILDSEGKYLLADQQLFQLPTNYSLALDASQQQDGNFPEFLAPEWLPELQLGETSSSQDAEKADIFCVGLLALKMCLVADGETY